MRLLTTLALCLTVLLAPFAALAATPAETAAQIRSDWAKAKQAYLASVQPYASQPANATLVAQYTAALDKTGATLEKYIALKLTTPAPPATTVTPVVDQLIKDLAALRTLNGKATGPLVNVLGNALSQHSLTTQTALKNMR